MNSMKRALVLALLPCILIGCTGDTPPEELVKPGVAPSSKGPVVGDPQPAAGVSVQGSEKIGKDSSPGNM